MNSAVQITNLLYRYGELIDSGDLAGAAALFAGARVWLGPETEIPGEELAERFRRQVRLYPCGTPRTRHVVTNPIVEIDEQRGTAAARSVYTVFQQTEALPLQAICSGRYLDEFVLDQCRWRFGSRRYTLDLVGDLSQHLLPTAMLNAN